MPRRVLIVGNGKLPPRPMVAREVRWADHVLGADGGADRLHRLGWTVDEVVGDLDSLSPSMRRRLGPARVHRVRDPNSTDLDKCLSWALHHGAKTTHVVGTTAGRLDHVLASFASLARLPDSADVRLIDERFEAWKVRSTTRFTARKGFVVSLWSPSGARGVTTNGLQWPLRNARLPLTTLGIHNVALGGTVEVRVASGVLFVLKGRFAEPHA